MATNEDVISKVEIGAPLILFCNSIRSNSQIFFKIGENRCS